jgi:hypothetical protein
VGVTDARKPACWNCGSREHMVEGHKYRAPTSASWLHPMLHHVTVITEENNP